MHLLNVWRAPLGRELAETRRNYDPLAQALADNDGHEEYLSACPALQGSTPDRLELRSGGVLGSNSHRDQPCKPDGRELEMQEPGHEY